MSKIDDLLGTGKVGVEVVKQSGEMVKPLVENLFNPVTKTLGQRVDDLADIILTPIELLKIYKDEKLITKFREKIVAKADAIPIDSQVIEFPVDIVGTAIEVARLYIEDEKTIEMLSNFIANSLESKKSKLARLRTLETIKWMDSVSSDVMSYFKDWDNKGNNILIAADLYVGEAYSNLPVIENVIVDIESAVDICASSASVSYLIRSGLLLKFHESNLFADRFINDNINSQLLEICRDVFRDKEGKQMKIFPKMHCLRLTPLGQDFVTVCFNKTDWGAFFNET